MALETNTKDQDCAHPIYGSSFYRKMRIFVLDPHGVYRRGLAACLAEVEDVGDVSEAATPEEAFAVPELANAEVIVVDPHRFGGSSLIRRLVDNTNARVVACSAQHDPDEVLAIIQAGAIGYLCKDTLTPEALSSAAAAAARGAGVLAPELLSEFMQGLTRVSRDLLEPNGLSLSRLSTREQQVLSLVAEGHSTREVAVDLHYSERTVKNVLHDVVTKLNARTRSQAVAEAVRQGLI
jgi:DNA-binding NarL/FixJ family response regulator